VSTPAAGFLMAQRDAASLATAWRDLVANTPARQATRRHAEGFSWDPTTQGQLDLFQRVVDGNH
jgi:hypothetical protein